jgi:3'5'-cyclic nucleotide phosphodiesterase
VPCRCLQYHNKTHAADVLQGMHCLLSKGGLQRRINDEAAMLSSYLAAVIHDYEHRGLNNDYLVRAGDDLAFTYNDISPMENHHVAAAFKLMKSEDYNFVKWIPREKWVSLATIPPSASPCCMHHPLRVGERVNRPDPAIRPEACMPVAARLPAVMSWS